MPDSQHDNTNDLLDELSSLINFYNEEILRRSGWGDESDDEKFERALAIISELRSRI